MLSNSMHRGFAVASATWLFLGLLPNLANAHFLYATSAAHQGHREARLYFSEGAFVEAERMPPRITEAMLWVTNSAGMTSTLSGEKVDREEQPILAATIPTEPCSVQAKCQYGVYQSFLLTYYAKHLHGEIDASPSKNLDLDVVPVRTKEGTTLTVLWKGMPAPGAQLVLATVDDETEATTDANGIVEWKTSSVGPHAVRAHFIEKDCAGELDGKKYTSAHHYSTVTFHVTKSNKGRVAEHMATLPEAISSFGAAVSGNWLYVYSGHTGKAHDHSKDNLSPNFRRISLDGGNWEELPCQTPLQGLALVAHKGLIYRIGGMTAHNSIEEDADLHSTSDFACFDPSTKKWQSLPSLPKGRSSHDAVVGDGKIYVSGGWCLNGSDDGEWHSDVLVFDLNNPDAKWKTIEQPFQRRGLATSHIGSDLFVIGGMNEDHEIERTVNVYSVADRKWSTVAELPGEGMNGFGVSAWNVKGRLLVSGSNGHVYRLSEDRKSWEPLAKLDTPRFFHQLVPTADGNILAVGGASMKKGHLTSIEQVQVAH